MRRRRSAPALLLLALLLAMLLVMALALIPAGPASATPDPAGSREHAAALARALRAADQELAAGQARLAASRRRLALVQASAARARATLASAEDEAERLQAEVDARARAAWMTGAAPPVLAISLMITADSPSDLLARGKLLERVAAERGALLTELAAARDDAERVRAALDLAERDALVATTAVSAQVSQLAEVRVARARAKAMAERQVGRLQPAADDLSAESGRVRALIKARDAAARARPAAMAGQGGHSGLAWPVPCALTSDFGARRGPMHEGIDLGCPLGTPVKAAKGGVVLSAGSAGGYGQLVLIAHGGGLVTAYAHNSALLVRPGQAVTAGQVVARSGSSGSSTAPHLHFEVRVDGVPRDPLAWLP